MACEICSKFEGDSITFFSDFLKVFNVISSITTSMTETGKAECQACAQFVAFDYDETLIPKLRVQFLNEKD